MKVDYDKVADAIYIKVREGAVEKTIKMTDKMIVDTGKDGNVIGIELLEASHQIDAVNDDGKTFEEKVLEGIPLRIINETPQVV